MTSLLRAENASLTTDDVDQILRRTARDVGPTGFDNGTGAGAINAGAINAGAINAGAINAGAINAGAINAGAALAYVRTHDVQRARKVVSTVISEQTLETGVDLLGSGYWQYAGSSCSGCLTAEADRRTFRVRVPFAQTFTDPPDVWVRWSESDGYNSAYPLGATIAQFDPFSQDLRVVGRDATGFTVEGHYWFAEFYNTYGQRCSTRWIPKHPRDFRIAYTAVGREGPPPVSVSISGPTLIDPGQRGTWTANAQDGDGVYTYRWYVGSSDSGPWTDTGATSRSYSRSFPTTQTAHLRVRVRSAGHTATDQHTVTVYSDDCDPLCEPFPTRKALQAKALALPDTFALHASAPHPIRRSGTLRYDVPEPTDVRIAVYDLMGRRVGELVNGPAAPGVHHTSVDATAWPSGTYFVRMQAGTFTTTRRLTVVR